MFSFQNEIFRFFVLTSLQSSCLTHLNFFYFCTKPSLRQGVRGIKSKSKDQNLAVFFPFCFPCIDFSSHSQRRLLHDAIADALQYVTFQVTLCPTQAPPASLDEWLMERPVVGPNAADMAHPSHGAHCMAECPKECFERGNGTLSA